MIVERSLALHNHPAVRDALGADPVLWERYAAVKKAVGVITTAADIIEYGHDKNAVVQEILTARRPDRNAA